MFRVGQVIEKNGKKYVVIDLISENKNKYKKRYVVFAVVEEKVDYVFYEIINMTSKGYDLKEVTDSKIKKFLFDKIIEES